MANDLLTPTQLGFDINTSNVVLYDGGTLAVISPGVAPDLNAVILAIDSEIVDINTTIAGLTAHISASSSITTYDGDKVFSNFTLVGIGLNEVFSEVATLVSTNISSISALETTNIATGGSTPLFNAAPYPVGPAVTNVDEALIAIDSGIKSLDTDKIDEADVIQILDAGYGSFIISGTVPAAGAGPFDVDISEITLFRGDTNNTAGGLVTKGATTVVVAASKDNYIDFDFVTTSYIVTSLANGDPEPIVAANQIRITLAITDGSGITSIVNLADNESIAEGNLKRNSVSTVRLRDGAVTDPKLAVSGATPGTFPFSTVTVTDKGIATSVVSEVTLTALADEEFLKFDSGSSKWLNVPIVGGILPAGGSNGDVLTFNTGSGDWEAVAPIAFTAIPLAGTAAPITGDLEFGAGIKIFRSTSSLTLNTNDITITGDNFNVTSTDSLIDAETTFTANMILTESAAPGSPTNNGVVLNAADRGAIAGTSSLNILVEDGTEHIIGDLVGFGTLLPDPSAAVEVNSTTGGLRVPNMTTAQRDAINGGVFAEGLIIYNTTNNQFQGRTNAQWINLG